MSRIWAIRPSGFKDASDAILNKNKFPFNGSFTENELIEKKNDVKMSNEVAFVLCFLNSSANENNVINTNWKIFQKYHKI